MSMRVFIIVAVCSFIHISASTFGQKVTLKVNNKSLIEVFGEIRKQTGYDFVFKGRAVSDLPSVTLDIRNKDFDEFIRDLCVKFDLTYQLVDNTVLIQKTTLQSSSNKNLSLKVVEQKVLTGSVRDSLGNPLSGATVKLEGTNSSTLVDQRGNFRIENVSPDAYLIVSFVGYRSKRIKVEEKHLTIILSPLHSNIEEVTVNAGYYRVSNLERTGNISKITSEVLERQPVTNVLSALQGRVTGLDVFETSGLPGSDVKINIRGVNSIGAGNQPLFIIDGVPFSSESLGDPLVSRQFSSSGVISSLNTLNISDIESVEVLKDADATSIYGSRGANGVILVTLKKSTEGGHKIDFRLEQGFSQPARGIKMLSTEEYLKLRRLLYDNDNKQYPTAAYDINGTWDENRYTDWYKELMARPASRAMYSVGISGGTKKVNTLLRANYLIQRGMNPGNFKYIKPSVLFNMNSSLFNKLDVSFSGNFSSDYNDSPAKDLISTSAFLPPNAPKIYKEDGSLNWENSTWENPYAVLKDIYRAKTRIINGSLNLNYNLLNTIRLMSRFGYSIYDLDEYFLHPLAALDPAKALTSNSYAYSNFGNKSSWIIEPQASWTGRYGKSKIEAMIGGTIQKNNSENRGESGSSFPSDILAFDISTALDYKLRGINHVLYKYIAGYGRLNYSYDKKYIVNITGRRDGSSRFGLGKQFANFAAIGTAWNFSEEQLVKDKLPFISLGKFRASYGLTGNDQIGDYQFLNIYGSYNYNYGKTFSLVPIQHYNPDFSWEVNKKLEFALELSLFKDRVGLIASWFKNRSSNQLVGYPLPGMTGFTSVRANLDAVVQNTGIELELSSELIKKEKFLWELSANFTKPNNKLVSYPGLEYSTYSEKLVVGQPLNITKVYEYSGVDMETGLYKVVDKNADGKITELDDRTDYVYLGSKFFGGINNMFRYKNLQLDVFFQFVNKKGNNYSFLYPTYIASQKNAPNFILDNWDYNKENPKYQKISYSTEAVKALENYRYSSGVYSSASYVRLKNITLNYRLSPKWIGRSMNIYVQGQNLFTFTNYLGQDPENSTSNSIGPLKTWSFGINFTL